MTAERRRRIGWRLFGAGLALTLFFRLALSLFGFRRLVRLFPPRERNAPDAYAGRVALAVQAASRCVPGSACLVQACAAMALLNWRGYAATLRVGVRRGNNDQLVSHAWLLSGGFVVLGGTASEFEQYRPIADFG